MVTGKKKEPKSRNRELSCGETAKKEKLSACGGLSNTSKWVTSTGNAGQKRTKRSSIWRE